MRGFQTRRGAVGSPQRAFTLIELLVVISIISVLMGILLPALTSVRRQATALTGMRNQREVATAVNLFAADNGDLYPPSVATLGMASEWHWYDPTILIGVEKRTPQMHRSISAYLHPYIADAHTVFCPAAPKQYTYLQESWDAGDAWDNPDNELPLDPVNGTYCFLWNYLGYLGGPRQLFKGPRGPVSGGPVSQLLVTDYYGYGHWRTPDSFASCERLPGGDILAEQWLDAAWWKADGNPGTGMPHVKLRAAYTDGHVQTYYPNEVSAMRVSMTPDGLSPTADGGASRGIFYIPRNAIR
ncbi:MAG: type II secretion system GspH family protein [Planctomycetes bacterium]|nr:type II secretion system GspH family protein [Planctomycetota bacterium]